MLNEMSTIKIIHKKNSSKYSLAAVVDSCKFISIRVIYKD